MSPRFLSFTVDLNGPKVDRICLAEDNSSRVWLIEESLRRPEPPLIRIPKAVVTSFLQPLIVAAMEMGASCVIQTPAGLNEFLIEVGSRIANLDGQIRRSVWREILNLQAEAEQHVRHTAAIRPDRLVRSSGNAVEHNGQKDCQHYQK